MKKRDMSKPPLIHHGDIRPTTCLARFIAFIKPRCAGWYSNEFSPDAPAMFLIVLPLRPPQPPRTYSPSRPGAFFLTSFHAQLYTYLYIYTPIICASGEKRSYSVIRRNRWHFVRKAIQRERAHLVHPRWKIRTPHDVWQFFLQMRHVDFTK